MNRFPRHSLPFALAGFLTLAACGTISSLTREANDAPMRIADFSRVEVLDFSASDAYHSDDAKKQADYDADIKQARREFADKIAEKIKESGAFAEVSRLPLEGAALRVTGDISRYDKGNIVARGLTGFAGRPRFDATVDISDARSDRVLTTLKIDRNSWPLPIGASLATLQTTNVFMNEAARKIASELAAKKRGEVPN